MIRYIVGYKVKSPEGRASGVDRGPAGRAAFTTCERNPVDRRFLRFYCPIVHCSYCFHCLTASTASTTPTTSTAPYFHRFHYCPAPTAPTAPTALTAPTVLTTPTGEIVPRLKVHLYTLEKYISGRKSATSGTGPPQERYLRASGRTSPFRPPPVFRISRTSSSVTSIP